MPGRTAAAKQREVVLAAARASLERLEAGRRVFLKGRALALAQRMALYARDELAMSNLRIRVCRLACSSACRCDWFLYELAMSNLRMRVWQHLLAHPVLLRVPLYDRCVRPNTGN